MKVADGKTLRSSTSSWRTAGASASSKVLVMGVSGLFGIVSARLIIEHFGVAAYAQYGLLTSMTALIPFADLGLSAAIINVVAGSARPNEDIRVRRTILTSFRVLTVSALVLIALGIAFSALGLWRTILGAGLESGATFAAFGCVLIFAVGLPLGVGQRILTGLGKNHLQILTQAVAAPLILVGVIALVLSSSTSGNLLPVISYGATTLSVLVAFGLAARILRPQVGLAVRAVPRLRSEPGARTMDVAWPMLVQLIALPIAMQTDRLLLSHLGTSQELAQYNLASQLFGLVIQTIAAAGIALWPLFVRARSGREIRSPMNLAVGFLVGGLVLALSLAGLLPWIVPVVTNNQLSLSPWLVGAFILLVAGQAVKYPLGMYMTDRRGLRFQVVPIVIMAPLNLGLSWVLIAPIGAAGPVVGSAVTVILCQVVPNYWYVRRDLRNRRAALTEVVHPEKEVAQRPEVH